MTEEQTLIAFENTPIRRHFDEATETWYFSIVDVIAVLSESVNPRDYWFRMKVRVKIEDGLELSTICRQLKLKSSYGKKYATDCANVEGLLRIFQSAFRIILLCFYEILAATHSRIYFISSGTGSPGMSSLLKPCSNK